MPNYAERPSLSVQRRILGAILTVGLISVGVKVAALGKEVVLAASFGTSDELDAFLVAIVLPTFIVNVVAGSFSAALIPKYISVRESYGVNAARALFANVVAVSVVLLVALSMVLAVTGPAILRLLGSGFPQEKLFLSDRLYFQLLPMVLLSGLATVWGAVLNAEERFALATTASLAIPLMAIVCVVFLGRRFGIQSLIWGTMLGYAFQLLLLGLGLYKRNLPLVPRRFGMTPEVRSVLSQYLPAAGGTILLSSTTIIDQAMAASLQPGSVALLTYGTKMVGLVTSIGVTALGTAVLPFFSSMVAQADWPALRRSLKIYGGLILCLALPVTGAAVILAVPLIRVFYEHGLFTHADTLAAGRVQAMFALQIPFYVLGTLFVRVISSVRRNVILLWGAVVSAVLNISLDFLLMRVMGVAGIALATSAVYLASFVYLGVMLLHVLREKQRLGSVCA